MIWLVILVVLMLALVRDQWVVRDAGGWFLTKSGGWSASLDLAETWDRRADAEAVARSRGSGKTVVRFTRAVLST